MVTQFGEPPNQLCDSFSVDSTARSPVPVRVSQPPADFGDGIDIFYNCPGRADLELFAFVHAAEGAAVPGAVARDPDQQGMAASLAWRPVHASFKMKFLDSFGHFTSVSSTSEIFKIVPIHHNRLGKEGVRFRNVKFFR